MLPMSFFGFEAVARAVRSMPLVKLQAQGRLPEDSTFCIFLSFLNMDVSENGIYIHIYIYGIPLK